MKKPPDFFSDNKISKAIANWLGHSFKNKVFATMLFSILLLVFLCNVLIMQFQIYKNQQELTVQAKEQLSQLESTLDHTLRSYVSIAAALEDSPIFQAALRKNRADSKLLWQQLFEMTKDFHEYAQFDVFNTEGRYLYSTSSTISPGGSLPVDWGILYAARQSDGMVFHSTGDDYAGYNTLAPSAIFVSACTIRHYNHELLGYLVVSMNQDHFDRLFGSRRQFSELLLLDSHWHTIYCSQTLFRASGEAAEMREHFLNAQSLEGFDKNSCFFLTQDGLSRFYLILQQPRFYTDQALQTFRTVTALMGLLCLPLCLLCALFLCRHLAQPVQQLDKAMAEVQKGNFKVHLALNTQDEFGRLGASFNLMVKEYQENLKRQRELNEAQIRILRAQLNPHFLYNTLDSMKWLAITHQAPTIASLATDLAILLRASISADEQIALADELEFLERYIEIQTIRFADSFTYEVVADHGCLNCLIPKLSLQPIVENSILHGVAEREDGFIKLTAALEGGCLILSVYDNGCGIPKDILDWLNAEEKPMLKGHMGLFNVNQIIRYHYGKNYGLFGESASQEYSCVRVRLPINRKENLYV